MNESMLQLEALLSGAHVPEQTFAPNSRYVNTPLASYQMPDGTRVSFVCRRFIPPVEAFVTTAFHTVARNERPDLLAAKYLGDPEAYWRLCDGNGVVRPGELTETVGRRVRIAAPASSPGEGTDD